MTRHSPPIPPGLADILELARNVCDAPASRLFVHGSLQVFRAGNVRSRGGDRFRQAVRLRGPGGETYGTLEVADWRPRTYSQEQVTALAALGRVASTAFQLQHGLAEARASFPGAEVGGEVLTMAEAERRAIVAALARTRGNISAAIRVLKMGRTTLYRKLQQYGIDPGRPRRRRRGEAGPGAAPAGSPSGPR